MRFWIILLPLILTGFGSAADPYLLFREKDKIGIKDDAGKVLIPASFDALGWSDGSFSVVSGVTGYKINDHWGLINLKKEFLSKAEYESMTWPGGDRIIAQKKINAVRSATGCLDLKGQVSVPFRYDGIKISGLRAVVFLKQKAGYQYGLIDLNGQELIPVRYASILPLGTLRYAVENNAHKTALYSDLGKAVTEFRIDSISDFRDSHAIIYQNSLQGLISREGEIIADPKFLAIRNDQTGSMFGRLPDDWKVLSGDNKVLRKVDAEQLTPFTRDLYQVTRKGLHGITDHNFSSVLSPEYGYLSDLSEGKIVAAKNGKYGIIHMDGKVVIPFEYDTVIREGRLVRVRLDRPGKSTWSLYDTFAIRKTEKEFDFIGPFNGAFFPARKNQHWGAIDRYGKESVRCVYDSMIAVSDHQIAVHFMGQYGIITSEEKWLLLPQAQRAIPLEGDRYWVKTGTTFFLRDYSGKDIYFTDNPIVLRKEFMIETSPDGSEKRIDYQGRIVERSSPVFAGKTEKVFPESEGLRGIKKDGKFGFVDDRGRLRIANRYDGIGLFRQGLAPVKILSKWGYISKLEKIVVQPVYDEAGEFSNNRAIVKRAGKYGVIDMDGKQLISTRYDSISESGDYYFLRNGKLFGLSDHQGQLITDTRFDSIEILNNGYLLIHRDGKSGLLTLQGISTVPLLYDQLIFDKDRNEFLGLIKSEWMRIEVKH